MARCAIQLSARDLSEIVRRFYPILGDKAVWVEVWETDESERPLVTLDNQEHRIEVVIDV